MVPRKLDCSHHLSVFQGIVEYVERRDQVPFDAEEPVSSMLEVFVAVLTRARLAELGCTQRELVDLDERFRAVTIDVGADWTPQYGLGDRFEFGWWSRRVPRRGPLLRDAKRNLRGLPALDALENLEALGDPSSELE